MDNISDGGMGWDGMGGKIKFYLTKPGAAHLESSILSSLPNLILIFLRTLLKYSIGRNDEIFNFQFLGSTMRGVDIQFSIRREMCR